MRKLCLALLVLGGCIAGAGYSTRDRITNAAREYNDGVRWGRWEQAAEHVAKDSRTHFLDRHKALEDDLEIADYELVAIDVDKSGKMNRASARVDYTWTLKNEGLVKKTSTMQKWEERPGSEGWVMAREERLKGAPLTLFEEPQAK